MIAVTCNLALSYSSPPIMAGISRHAIAPRMEIIEAAPADALVEPPPPPTPIIQRIAVGNGILAGDAGFDPLGLADSADSLAWYREAEVKHARLAMLAAAGWPVSELLNKQLSQILGAGDGLLVGGKAPSVLNGGLDGVSTVYWLAAVGLAMFVESKSIDQQLFGKERLPDYLPGMMGFDPLGMDSKSTREAEILNGRIAMIAITAFAVEELVTGASVVSETPFFFQPIWSSLGF